MVKLRSNATFFLKSRRQLILLGYDVFQQYTSDARRRHYLQLLNERGYITVDGVRISMEGDVTKGQKKVNLREARKHGRVSFGSSFGNGNMYLCQENPYSVVLKSADRVFAPKVSFDLLSDRDVIIPILRSLASFEER